MNSFPDFRYEFPIAFIAFAANLLDSLSSSSQSSRSIIITFREGCTSQATATS